MFKVIAKYAPAVAAFGVLATGSFGLEAHSAELAARLPSVTVRYADLNLNTPAGIETLHARLRAAAREVCDVREQRPLVETIAAQTCYRQALGAAVEHANLLTLNARLQAESTRGDIS